MADKKTERLDAIARYNKMIEKQMGKAVRPFRNDGFINLINRYGTKKDTTEQYKFIAEPEYPDELISAFYVGNGLFAKIIDAPAEEAVKNGFELCDIKDASLINFYEEALDELDWEETSMTAIKWSRLFGGSIGVMLINDGHGLEEPLDWRNIRSIDGIRVFDRSVIQPDYSSMYSYDPTSPFRSRGSRLGMPEYYRVFSRYGNFTVHESRCLTFQNGVLPENTQSTNYQIWGVPEYVRIHRAIRDAEIAHGNAPKLLDRSVQAIYKMKDLSAELATQQGEETLLRRLEAIDIARGVMNSMVIDADGEDYDFKTFQFSGINDVLSASCNMLSAVTNIPQTILFGQPVGGMSSTDDTAMENYYNYVKRIQKRQLRSNIRYLLSVIFQAGVRTGEVDEIPNIKVKFNPLWSLTDVEIADLDLKKAQIQQAKAQTAQIYVDMQAIDPTEVRKKLADSEEFDVENLLDEYDDEELFPEQDPQIDPVTGQPIPQPEGGEVPPGTQGKIMEQGELAKYGEGVDIEKHNTDPGTEGSASTAAPAATKLPQDMSAEELEKAQKAQENRDSGFELSNPTENKIGGVGVICVQNGAILVAERMQGQGTGLFGGPGGHIERGETPEQAAYRETEEEFGISPKELVLIGYGPKEPETGYTPEVFLCTKWEGEPHPVDGEMGDAMWLPPNMIEELRPSLFPPFADGYDLMIKTVKPMPQHNDGGPGSGNFGHEGVPGQVGGSAPSGKGLNDKLSSARDAGRSEYEKAAAETVNGVPVGTKFTQIGVSYTKTGDDEWTSSDGEKFSNKDILGYSFNYLSAGAYPAKFEDVTSEEIAEQKIASGEIAPEDAPSVDTSKAIAEYQDYGYKAVNDSLREGKELEGEAAFIDEGLQQAFSKAEPLATRTTVERDSGMAVTAEAFEKTNNPVLKRAASGSLAEAWRNPEVRKAIEDVLIGYEFQDKGYTSTSSDHNAFVDFANGNGGEDYFSSYGCKETMAIGVPKGSKVLDLGDSGFIAGSGEHEVILNKGGKYTISGIEYDYETQSLRLYCEYSDGSRSDSSEVELPDIIRRRLSKNGNFPEKTLDKSPQSVTIKSQLSEDEFKGHKGRPGQRGGSLPELAAGAVTEAISSGVISRKLDRNAQSKHKKGSEKYNKAVADGDRVGCFTIDDDELERIIQEKAGTGQGYGKNGQFKEVIDTGKTVAKHAPRKGEDADTSRITVHYGKHGCHAVPAAPKK